MMGYKIEGHLSCPIVKNIMAADKQPGEDVHRRKSPKYRSSSPYGLDRYPFSMWLCLPTQKLSESCASGNFMEAFYRHDWLFALR